MPQTKLRDVLLVMLVMAVAGGTSAEMFLGWPFWTGAAGGVLFLGIGVGLSSDMNRSH